VYTEINLNGGIIANKGFIKQFATPGTKVILGKYVSAWGGIQSAGQFVGQVVRISVTQLIPSIANGCLLAIAICHRVTRPETSTIDHLGRSCSSKPNPVLLSFLPLFSFSFIERYRVSVMKTDSGLEYFHRIIRQPLATLAGCKAPLRHGRWYVAINYASVPIRDRSNPIERILHQCIQLVSPVP
jgi:hypothetical protein